MCSFRPWIAASLLIASFASGQSAYDPELERINIREHLGETVPGDAQFVNEKGETVTFGDYFVDDRPIVLVLAYYECPMLCTKVLNGLSTALKDMKGDRWTPGQGYRVLTISIDPGETPELARKKQAQYVQSVEKGDFHDDWQFWTGKESSIASVAGAIGFDYFYDEKRDEYAHAAAVYVLTPERVISRYLYGVDYGSRDMQLALMDASEGKIGNSIDRVIWRCFHYNDSTGQYTPLAFNIMRLGAVATLIAVGIPLSILWRREQRRSHSEAASQAQLQTN